MIEPLSSAQDHPLTAAEIEITTSKNKERDVIMNSSNTKAIDPICGMTVDTATALHAERNGETFYFCCGNCREKFLSNPADAKPDGKSGGCCCG